MLPMTTILASALSLMFVWLSIQVIKYRRKLKVLIGDGGQQEMVWAIRAQGNFSEYVPITLIIFACAEYNKTDWRVLSVFAGMLMCGRLLHAYGLLYARDNLGFRVKGMLLTFWTIISLSIWNIGFLGYKFLTS
ncbi:MAG: glutathione S-transferase [Gammaproteobacteria bacterium]|jgi:hypothetical protein|nr:glutathione S-transferase [Gammaproteobacteria bacterium]NBT44573.1 glutathione S-transferase [Gammaproteobacteria bacterium]NBY22308.1 glutathione S-transferase [Gammaproteobacteria bacterium]NDE33704.1 glutathione S-transferase [Gammaproteobacteria bacterium]NDE55462.1 glutathione S-transferase [Gammaproteobacteria bacterium]